MAKNNKIPKCPPLRFPQFSDEWQQTTLGEIAEITSGYSGEQEQMETPYRVSRIETISSGVIDIERVGFVSYDAKLVAYKLSLGDILFSNINSIEHIGKSAIVSRPIDLYHGMNLLRLKAINIDPYVLYYHLQRDVVRNRFRSIANKAVSQASINQTILGKEPVLLAPTLAEQEKIASFLSLIDERIQSCSETIAQMKSLRISFYRTISHQRKREWQNIFLRDILTERKENNSMHYDVYSVSVSRGIVNQIEHLGRSFAAKDTSHYNTVHFGDVVYTKSPTGRFPYGIVKQSRVKSAVAVSPLYGVYIPNNYYIGVVLNNFFESSVRTSNYLAPLIQKGAKNTMNITTQHFLDNKILLPTSSEEQKKMADYLILLDERIEVEEELLKQYEMQKKYLLRQMFI